MADNSLKTPFAASLNTAASQRAKDAIQLLGKALPASVVKVQGQIVTVKFEMNGVFTLPQVRCPIYGAEYARMPTQIGDKGYVLAADVNLGGVTGLGGGVANLTRIESNLTALVFHPLSTTSFPTVDGGKAHVTGPTGVILQDDSGASIVTMTPTSIVIQQGTASISITNGTISFTGVLEMNGASYANHIHTGIGSTGTLNTGTVVVGT